MFLIIKFLSEKNKTSLQLFEEYLLIENFWDRKQNYSYSKYFKEKLYVIHFNQSFF